MSDPSKISGDLIVTGTATFGGLNVPSGSITNSNIAALAGVDATKLVHRAWEEFELFGPTTTIIALTKRLIRLRANATLIDATAEIFVQATGADRTVTVDIQKSTGGGAFATILSVTINITNGTVIRTAVSGTFSATGLIVGDILQAVVSVAGAAGAQAQGLGLTLTIDRQPA